MKIEEIKNNLGTFYQKKWHKKEVDINFWSILLLFVEFLMLKERFNFY